jgi:flavodoxin I
MKILLVYATYSGSTEEVKNIIETILIDKKHQVTVVNPKDVTFESINISDRIILCTPTWDFEGKDGQPHEDYFVMQQQLSGKILENKKFAIIGLGDSSYPKFCGSVNVLESFVQDLKGQLVIPSMKVDGYYYDPDKYKTQIIDWTNSLLI